MRGGARAVALRVVRRVVEERAYSNLTLSSELRRSALAVADRALAAELAYGTLRRMLRLDSAIESRAGRPVARMTPGALAALRLGAYQLLFTRIPAHAAVGETVGLVAGRERGFVNGVLRAIAADPPSPPEGDDPAAIAARTGVAPWAVEELARLLGREGERAAEALAERAPLALRAVGGASDRLETALRGSGLEPRRGAIVPETVLVDAGAPDQLPGFREGWFAVQDEASAFVSGAVSSLRGDRVLDACAGPGGKAAHLAELAGGVVAGDVSPKRAGLVVRAAERLGVRALVLVQDARRPALEAVFDRVLVDAPCSGVGAARRRPELLWRPLEEEVSRLAELQLEIVAAASELLVPGGRLIYSVCTFPREETDGVCERLLEARPYLEPSDVRGPDGPAPRVRLWPHRHGTDAMFVAAFVRLT
ncbi:MAG TPA: transcription antitermination factor NusB [Actinomycetota bacterium]|nr:transcription antitermination factor NusB [Actinomycetota bacterium]